MASPFATNLFGQARDDVGDWAERHDLAALRAEFDLLETAVAVLTNPPSARVLRNTTYSFTANAAYGAITWEAEDWDTEGMWDAGAPTKFTALRAGKFLVYANVRWAVNGTGVRVIGVRKNGTGTGSPTHGNEKRVPLSAGDSVDMHFVTMVGMAVGDYVEILGWQNSGAALNIEHFNGASHAGIKWEGQ